jgi:hypothetical protein
MLRSSVLSPLTLLLLQAKVLSTLPLLLLLLRLQALL